MYKYIDPLSQGYVKTSISKAEHNKLFKHRQINWSNRYEYYYSEDQCMIQKFASRVFIIGAVAAYPFLVIYAGIDGIGELHKEYKELFFQKKYGNFSADIIYLRGTDNRAIFKAFKNNS